jgi:hypothetical protein
MMMQMPRQSLIITPWELSESMLALAIMYMTALQASLYLAALPLQVVARLTPQTLSIKSAML